MRWRSTLRCLFPALLGVALALHVTACSRVGVSGSAAALSSNGSATLSWTTVTKDTHGLLLYGLAGYRLRYGRSANTLSTVVDLANPKLTSYLLSNLPAGTWYFGLTAYTSSGVESAMSNIVQKRIP